MVWAPSSSTWRRRPTQTVTWNRPRGNGTQIARPSAVSHHVPLAGDRADAAHAAAAADRRRRRKIAGRRCLGPAGGGRVKFAHANGARNSRRPRKRPECWLLIGEARRGSCIAGYRAIDCRNETHGNVSHVGFLEHPRGQPIAMRLKHACLSGCSRRRSWRIRASLPGIARKNPLGLFKLLKIDKLDWRRGSNRPSTLLKKTGLSGFPLPQDPLEPLESLGRRTYCARGAIYLVYGRTSGADRGAHRQGLHDQPQPSRAAAEGVPVLHG